MHTRLTAIENTKPYIIDWGAATSDFPKIVGVIRINHIIEGYIVMQCPKDGITEVKSQSFLKPLSFVKKSIVAESFFFWLHVLYLFYYIGILKKIVSNFNYRYHLYTPSDNS